MLKLNWRLLTATTVMALAMACMPAATPIVVIPQPPPVVNRATQPLHMGGPVSGSPASFVYPDGTEYRVRGITDFLLFARYVNGEDIKPVLQDRVNVGANLVRVFGMLASWGNPSSSPADGIIHFYPQEHADYVAKLRSFVDLLQSYGLRVEFVVFADAQFVMPNQGDQLNWWNLVWGQLWDKNNVLLQVCNECGKNGVDPNVFPNPQDTRGQLLASRDSGFESANPPPANGFAYSAYSSSRADIKWYVEQGSSMFYLIYGWGPGEEWQGTQGASILDEPLGAAERTIPGRRSNDVNAFKQLARSLVWGNGAVFHCDDCIQSVILGPTQHNAAVEFEGNLP